MSNNFNNRPSRDQIYGRAYLDEHEHVLCEEEIRNFCIDNGIKFMYYRTLKYDHHAMWREFKLEGPRNLLRKFDDEFCKFIEKPQRNDRPNERVNPNTRR